MNVVHWVITNWVVIIAGMVAIDRVLQIIGQLTGNQWLDNLATTIAGLIAKIPANPPKV